MFVGSPFDTTPCDHCVQGDVLKLTARAEAAEARVKELETALRSVRAIVLDERDERRRAMEYASPRLDAVLDLADQVLAAKERT